MKSFIPLLFFITCVSCERYKFDVSASLIRDESYCRNIQINVDKDSLVVLQWNLGHFSNGKLTESEINHDEISEVIVNFRKVFESYSADLISLNEYSDIMGDYGGKEYITRDILFYDYDYAYLGIQKNYSCNSLISSFQLQNVRYNSFLCNESAQITHTSLIKADDYYYISSLFHWHGKKINLISTHLAFDENNQLVAKAQIEELVDRYKDCEYVILCGDWNSPSEFYDIFINNGYQLANCDQYGQIITYPFLSRCLDNIIVKGIQINNVKTINTDLSDHYPIICTIKLN